MKKLTLFCLILALFGSWGCKKEKDNDLYAVSSITYLPNVKGGLALDFLYNSDNNITKEVLKDHTGEQARVYSYHKDSILLPLTNTQLIEHQDQYEVFRLTPKGLIHTSLYRRYYSDDTLRQSFTYYQYNAEGYMTRMQRNESYYILYEYENGNLIRDKTYSVKDNTLLEIVTYTYNTKKDNFENRIINQLSQRYGKKSKNLLIELNRQDFTRREYPPAEKVVYIYKMNSDNLPEEINEQHFFKGVPQDFTRSYRYEKR